jgi:4-aminobutyrate aminotransferase / (S)-3-amino-2-methylpropionate transaminase / 5-aminovalerate transaminase
VNDQFGRMLPALATPPPGPESRRLAAELARFESPNVTFLSDAFPIFWAEARGANVRDVDGNVFVDMTAAFAVAAAGHGHPSIVSAVVEQAGRLLHGMGDVHPPSVKVELLKRLAEVAPEGLSRSILANSGAEAVEAALKTVAIATGKPRVLAFKGSYHGLTLGALAVSGREDFRTPFLRQLGDVAIFAPFPAAPQADSDRSHAEVADAALDTVTSLLDRPAARDTGAILVEPVQGRGGDVVPPDGWLQGLRRICDERGLLLVLDEIYTGFGRTGRWFACEHWDVIPDILVVGKALTGGLPFAACIGTDRVMEAWPLSTGEALHTSTFLGHPLGCAAALASLRVIEEEGLVERSAAEGRYIRERLQRTIGSSSGVREVRGLGLMIGIELVSANGSPDPGRVAANTLAAMQRGFITLGGGVHSNVLSLSPPLTIERTQTDAFLDFLEDILPKR